jgi:hypothetical protein
MILLVGDFSRTHAIDIDAGGGIASCRNEHC